MALFNFLPEENFLDQPDSEIFRELLRQEGRDFREYPASREAQNEMDYLDFIGSAAAQK